MRRDPTIKVWDIAVRLFHWSLVLGFVAAWMTQEGSANLHIQVGYVVVILIAFRLVWGLIGTRYARFSQFLTSPLRALGYMRDMKEGREVRYIGHNPAGAMMIVALLLMLIGTGVTGWMRTTDAYWGIAWVANLHNLLASVTVVLVILHVSGVIWASFKHHENLARAMITGRKRRPDPDDVS